MAMLVLNNAQVLINAVDLSNHTSLVTLTYLAVLEDNTAMSSGTTRSRIAGLLDWTLEVDFFNDFAASSVDVTLFPLVGAAAFAVEVRPVNGARSVTNPGYNGNVVLESYPPITGQVGKIIMSKVKFVAASALLRSTS